MSSAFEKGIVAIYAPSLVGVCMAVFLFGVSGAQCHVYFQNHARNDRVWIVALVATCFILDAATTAMDFSFVYVALVKHAGYPSVLLTAGNPFAVGRMLTTIIGFLVQVFLSWRVFLLTRNRFIMAGISITALMGLAGGIAVGWLLVDLDFADFSVFRIEAIIWLVPCAVCDSTITFILIWYLRGHRTGFKRTDDIIEKIIHLAVQTGLITTICALLDCIGFEAFESKNAAHVTFQTMLSKLYINSLISNLNARALKDGPSEYEHSRTAATVFARNEDVIALPVLSSAHNNERAYDGKTSGRPFAVPMCDADSDAPRSVEDLKGDMA